MIDTTISLANIIAVVVIVGGFLIQWGMIRSALTSIKQRSEEVDRDLRSLTTEVGLLKIGAARGEERWVLVQSSLAEIKASVERMARRHEDRP